MNAILKERVVSNEIRFVFFFAIFLSLCISKSFAQENQQPFDYSRTIWIVDNIDGKGIVYGLPNYEESRSAFIIIHKVLMKYVHNLEAFPDFTSVKDLTPEHRLVLMNDITEQQLLIGSNWISDGQRIALMDETDFNNVKNILTQRAKIDTAFTKHPINPLLRSLRKGIQDDPEGFEHRLQLSKDANSRELLEARKISFSSSSNQAQSTEINYIASSHSSTVLSSGATANRTTSHSKLVTQPSSKEITHTSNDVDDSFNFILGIAATLLAVFGGIGLIKRGKK